MEPDRYHKISEAIEGHDQVIPRGAGLSYCIASAGEGVHSISSKYFNRILDFDSEQQLIVVESGISVGALTAFCAQNDLILPVIPGHPTITIGGSIAFNVHGKSSFKNGLFGKHIKSFRLITPGRGELNCSETENHDLFKLTIGGFGLTGFISEVELRLHKLAGSSIQRTKIALPHLSDAADLLGAEELEDFQRFGWANLHARGKQFGSGIIFSDQLTNKRKSDLVPPQTDEVETIPKPWPQRLHRPTLTSAVNSLYKRWQLSRKHESLDLFDALFPLGGADHLQKAYGKRGYHEYSVLVPPENWKSFCQKLELILQQNHIAYPLTTLRLIKAEQHFLSFGGTEKGDTAICLNIDFPAGNNTAQLFTDLDRLSLDFQLKINLSKDNRVSSQIIQSNFAEYERFKAGINGLEFSNHFNSSLRRRLGV